jgi:hypothetical protein
MFHLLMSMNREVLEITSLDGVPALTGLVPSTEYYLPYHSAMP